MNHTLLEKIDKHKFYLLVHKIKQTKPQFDDKIEDNLVAIKGWRYNDDERIARNVISQIYDECGGNIEQTNKTFLSLSSSEIEPYIEKAVVYSAVSDYWYEEEKEWD
jgi:hypothetical protein